MYINSTHSRIKHTQSCADFFHTYVSQLHTPPFTTILFSAARNTLSDALGRKRGTHIRRHGSGELVLHGSHATSDSRLPYPARAERRIEAASIPTLAGPYRLPYLRRAVVARSSGISRQMAVDPLSIPFPRLGTQAFDWLGVGDLSKCRREASFPVWRGVLGCW